MSGTSFPFMALARRLRRSYGDVLLVADALAANRAMNRHENDAMRSLPHAAVAHVRAVVLMEHRRRDEVAKCGP